MPQGIIFCLMQPTQPVITPRSPRIGSGKRIYAVGDVHGRADLLEKLLGLIFSDAAGNMDNSLIFLGDYIDRGPDSRRVVDVLTQFVATDFNLITLKGNHEEMLLQFLEGEGPMMTWLRNGGRETLKSYGVDVADLYQTSATDEAMEAARRTLRKAMPGSHVEFLAALELTYQEGDYLFVHAGIRPGIPVSEQKEEDLIWIRKDFINSDADFGKIVVHGHSISARPVVSKNKIGIDTGAWRSDVLSALVLEGVERRFLST